MHVDHCIEALRLTLMCHGDTTPMLVLDDSSSPIGLKADFSAHHKCRKFDNLRSWMVKHELEETPRSDFRPEGYKGAPPKHFRDEIDTLQYSGSYGAAD